MNTDYRMTPTHDTAAVTATKLTVVWSGVAAGLSDWAWSDLAAAAAFVYSAILIIERVARLVAEILRSRDK